jgi:hypothetical protein
VICAHNCAVPRTTSPEAAHLDAHEDLWDCDGRPPAFLLNVVTAHHLYMHGHSPNCVYLARCTEPCQLHRTLRTAVAILASFDCTHSIAGVHTPRSRWTGRRCRWGRHLDERTPRQTYTAWRHTTGWVQWCQLTMHVVGVKHLTQWQQRRYMQSLACMWALALGGLAG